MEALSQFLNNFLVYHINAYYYFIYLLKYNYIYVFVIAAIGFMLYHEMAIENEHFVDDKRRII